jgi:glycosyltransferase involved in cell wall biosynthesis
VEFALSVNRWLRREGEPFQVVQTFFPLASNILILLNPRLRDRMVYTFHGDMYRLNLPSRIRMLPWYLRPFPPDEFLMKRAKRVVVLDDTVRSKILDGWKMEPERVVSIPFGIDTDKFNPGVEPGDVREKYGLEGKVSILYAANLIPRKGAEYLLKAAHILVNQMGYNQLQFLLAGQPLDRNYARRLSRLVEEYNLVERVRFLGFIPLEELTRLRVACDIFVDPTLEDNPNMATAEAIACGRPIVGTRTGGMAVLVVDGWNGFLVEPGDEGGLADRLRHLIDHPEERRRMGENSRQHALEALDWRKVAKRYLEVYQEVAYGS